MKPFGTLRFGLVKPKLNFLATTKKGEAVVEKNALPTMKHGGVLIMLWGSVAARGSKVSPGIEVEERLGIPARQRPKAYLEIDHELPLGKTEMKVLEWPLQSPDLNIIESLWRDLKYMHRGRKIFLS